MTPYNDALERFASWGVDTEAALSTLATTPSPSTAGRGMMSPDSNHPKGLPVRVALPPETIPEKREILVNSPRIWHKPPHSSPDLSASIFMPSMSPITRVGLTATR